MAVDLGKLKARVDEDYLLMQWETATHSDSHNQHKRRIAELKRLYRGDWAARFPKWAELMGNDPWIENIIKNGIHDVAGLASEARPSTVFIAKGDGDQAKKKKLIREAIAETLWEVSNGDSLLMRSYMDLIGTGMVAIAGFFNKKSDYAQFERLDPEGCYPDVRNGLLQDLLYIETIKLREAARRYPDLNLQAAEAWSDKDCQIVDYYNDQEVVKGIILTQRQKIRPDKKSVFVVDRWEHGLGQVPVAFQQVDTFDGAFRGLYDQAGGPVLARNLIIKYMLDYIESMVHAPFEAKNIMNSGDDPGPNVIYQHDPNSPESFMRRVAPAAPAPAVFGIVQYLEEQTSGETIQPPARQGQVQQSIASASFVAATQGRLTTVVKQLQRLVASVKKQTTYIGFKIEESYLDFEKPLYKPVGDKFVYTPSKDIQKWYHCRVEFGAAAGLDRLNADVRVLQHLGARLISRETGREQIEYISDPSIEQNKIDREGAHDAVIQRFAADPRVPVSAIALFELALAKGKSYEEALESVIPDLKAADQAAAQQAAGGEQLPGPPEAAGPAEEQAALQAGAQTTELEAGLPPAPLQQQIVRPVGVF